MIKPMMALTKAFRMPGETLQDFQKQIIALKAQCLQPGAQPYDPFVDDVGKFLGEEIDRA